MARRYGPVAGGVVALLGGFVVLFHIFIVQMGAVLELVDLSGRQRVLSQQVVSYAVRLGTADTAEARREAGAALENTLSGMRSNHRRLAQAAGTAGLGDRLADTYFNGRDAVDLQFQAFMDEAEAVLRVMPQPPSHLVIQRLMERGEGSLLAALERADRTYREHGEAEIWRLHILAIGFVVAIVIVLLIEAVTVFRPMVRRADAQMRDLLDVSADLRRVRDTLEDQVARRTHDLVVARDTAERASETKSRFLAMVGHDLLQPVKALGLFVTALERSCRRGTNGSPVAGSVPPDLSETLIDLRGAVASINALIKGLLDFSRAEHGLLTARKQPVTLSPLFAQLAAEYGPVAHRRGLRLRVVACQGRVESDPALLERILRNLLANALRYTVHGGVLLGCRHRGDMVRLEVHDTGMGLPRESLDRVHGAFVRGAGAGADDDEALGLGLAIVTELAAVLGHSTGVTSAEGRGSVFWIEVPYLDRTRSRQPDFNAASIPTS